jgi:hypothetical protein
MTNFALEKRFGEMGIAFARAKVGDRYVLEMLVARLGVRRRELRPPAVPRLPLDRRRDHLVAAGPGGRRASSRSLGEFTRELSSCRRCS